MIAAIVLVVNLELVNFFIGMSQSDFYKDSAGLVGLFVNATVFLGSVWLDLYSLMWSFITCLIIVNG